MKWLGLILMAAFANAREPYVSGEVQKYKIDRYECHTSQGYRCNEYEIQIVSGNQTLRIGCDWTGVTEWINGPQQADLTRLVGQFMGNYKVEFSSPHYESHQLRGEAESDLDKDSLELCKQNIMDPLKMAVRKAVGGTLEVTDEALPSKFKLAVKNASGQVVFTFPQP